MVNSLLLENKQLEELLQLMAQHLDHLAESYPGKDLEGAAAAAEARQISGHLSKQLLELQRESARARQAEEEQIGLRRRLSEEEMRCQELRRQLEAFHRQVQEESGTVSRRSVEEAGTT